MPCVNNTAKEKRNDDGHHKNHAQMFKAECFVQTNQRSKQNDGKDKNTAGKSRSLKIGEKRNDYRKKQADNHEGFAFHVLGHNQYFIQRAGGNGRRNGF